MSIQPTIANDPRTWDGVEIQFSSLPYEAPRVALDCGHSLLYAVRNYDYQPLFCGLCFFKHGFEAELPNRIHLSVRPRFATLAPNGNPETSPKFLAHLYLSMGLKPPKKNENLRHFRASRARGHYTKAAPTLFPVASALHKLMGYQPPLGTVLVKGVSGQTEREIARAIDASVINVHHRMAKAIRTAMGYLVDGTAADGGNSTRTDDRGNPQATRTNGAGATGS